MRKRNSSLILRLSEDEMQRLDQNVERSGVNRQTYLRHLITGYVPRAAPPSVFHDMMKELSRIGNNMNQIALKAHQLGVIDVKQYDMNVSELNRAIEIITDAVIKPQPITGTASKHDTVQEDGADVSAKSDLFEEIFGVAAQADDNPNTVSPDEAVCGSDIDYDDEGDF